jgi:hypothetical protein
MTIHRSNLVRNVSCTTTRTRHLVSAVIPFVFLGACATELEQLDATDETRAPQSSLQASYAGEYLQFIDNRDLAFFDSIRHDYFTLNLKPDGTFTAIVTARRADKPGHVVELVGGPPVYTSSARAAAESGIWRVTPGRRSFDDNTLVISPIGQPARTYNLSRFPPTDSSPLDFEEVVPRGSLGGLSNSLFRSSFFSTNTVYRLCLGGKTSVPTGNGTTCP